MAAPLARQIFSVAVKNLRIPRFAAARCLHQTSVMNFAKTNAQPQSEQNTELHLSDTCVQQLHKLGEQDNCLRVIVEGGGCSGFQYVFKIEKEPQSDDRIFERDGCRVIVDKDSLEFIDGSTVDFHEELIRSSFQITDNPSAEKGCSCGASFSVKL